MKRVKKKHKKSQQKNASKKKEALQNYKSFIVRLKDRDKDPVILNTKTAFEYFLSFLKPGEWDIRRERVMKYFERLAQGIEKPTEASPLSAEESRVAFHEDWMSWYMYLAECTVHRPFTDQESQSARIRPFFNKLGASIESLKAINGIEGKIHDMFYDNNNNTDSALFELVVAVCYIENGWQAEFIPETHNKTPDIKVTKGSTTLYVECKRLQKVTDYSESERQAWLRRWKLLSEEMLRYRIPSFVEVTFKKEVDATPQGLPAKAFKDLATCGAIAEGMCIENDDIKLCARHINKKRIDNHLKRWSVRHASSQMNALIDEQWTPEAAYTFLMSCKRSRSTEPHSGLFGWFITDVDSVYAAKWECIADESIDKKAKDVTKHLAKAVKQAPNDARTVVHIGYETLNGPIVEVARDQKIVETLNSFDFGDKDIACVFCHSFQSRTFPDGEYDFAETTRHRAYSLTPDDILPERLLLGTEQGTKVKDDTHWNQDLREILGLS
ncbi:hypothetical protein H7683_06685 [Ectopseudomonas mendocina]|uniref:hypothetical protein n=1 Tax=Ectopseudomonas mendocina TaxID=300 RepID=UPI001AE09AFF|nr:hypothetical protein [Pseudomonas mendocina]QTN47309.1 hypothetical protein H7683_06685 [Pseudomonas mendocina]